MESFGDYELMKRIAVGGMAEIFVARRRGPSGFAKRVALKRILPELARQVEFCQMFADEARLCASLSHPGLVQVFDYGEIDGTPYLVMEWIDGPDLAALIAEGGTLPPEPAAFMMAEIARTLAYVHDACDESGKSLGIVHRDLSPGNILISRAGDIKLGDFGVAKARGRMARTEAGQLKGTLSYLAPEQVSGGAVDKRTDVYALGLLLFEVLTGERYVQGENEVELLKAAASPEPRSARALCHAVPVELEKMLGRALAIDPENRYPNTAAVELDLRRIVSDPSGARSLLEQRVDLATGQQHRRRQTEMVSTDEEPGPFTRVTKPALATIGVIVLGLFGALAFLTIGAPEEISTDAPPRQEMVASSQGDTVVDASQVPEVDTDAGRSHINADTNSDAEAREPEKVASPNIPSNLTPQIPKKIVEESPRLVEKRIKKADESPPPPDPADSGIVEPRPSGPALTALLRAADGRRRSRGLVPGDDAEMDRLRTRAASLINEEAAEEQVQPAIAAYQQRIDAVDIDFEFINRKLRRIDRRIRALDQDSPLARELNALSRQALQRAMSGDYQGANTLLNRLLDRLR